MIAPACLDETTVLAFLDGTLPGTERSGVEAHLATCSACAELTTWAAAHLANTGPGSGRERVPFVGQLAAGSRVERYQILGVIGRGGMGEVYAAYHPDLDRRIALKVVHESGADTAERRARLLREARAIARLSHPNVVTVHDAGTVGDRVYIAMEFIDGETLGEWLRSAPRTWREIVDVFAAAGRGLAAAHAAKLVHRDFKPDNVMIGKDGSVRVMDFGLVRVGHQDLATRADLAPAGEDSNPGRAAGTTPDHALGGNPDRPPSPAPGQALVNVTRTGALLGTPAYMAPEQFRNEAIDARADQFSFCVALHEALHGARPPLPHFAFGDPAPAPAEPPSGSALAPRRPGAPPEPAPAPRRPGAPSWLRGIVARGLSEDPDRRFESMDRLLEALDRGRRRLRRRLSALVAGLTIALAVLGGWRSSRARRFDCAPPADRVAAAWAPNDPGDARRQSIQRVMLAGGRPEATLAWNSLSSALDGYVGRWQAMYREACAATQIRGEQSADALDLRMTCLNQSLDEVRALTDVLVTADGTAAGQAVAAASGLTPVDRCADLPLLRSVVPLPGDERTRRSVEGLQRSLEDVRALLELEHLPDALAKATALRPEVEATAYKPLLADLLQVTGMIHSRLGSHAQAAAVLEEAFFAAEAAHDDATAVESATTLTFVVGHAQGRHQDGLRWGRLATAILDRMGPGHARLRAWTLHDQAQLLMATGDLERARALFEQAIALKEKALGRDHPDVTISVDGLAQTLKQQGQLAASLATEDRAIEILTKHGILPYRELNNRAETLVALHRYAEAEVSFARALQIMEHDLHAAETNLAYPLAGLGEVKLATGHAADAVPMLERALAAREQNESDANLTADTQLTLARALWESSADRKRALALATKARATYASHGRAKPEQDAVAWLAAHSAQRP